MAEDMGPGPVPNRKTERQAQHASATWAAFLRDLCVNGWEADFAEKAAVSVLHHMEERIVGGEADDMEAQLPRRLRELLQQKGHHQGKPPEKYGLDGFLQRICTDLDLTDFTEAEGIARSVLQVVRNHLNDSESDQVMNQLPDDLRSLWLPTI